MKRAKDNRASARSNMDEYANNPRSRVSTEYGT